MPSRFEKVSLGGGLYLDPLVGMPLSTELGDLCSRDKDGSYVHVGKLSNFLESDTEGSALKACIYKANSTPEIPFATGFATRCSETVSVVTLDVNATILDDVKVNVHYVSETHSSVAAVLGGLTQKIFPDAMLFARDVKNCRVLGGRRMASFLGHERLFVVIGLAYATKGRVERGVSRDRHAGGKGQGNVDLASVAVRTEVDMFHGFKASTPIGSQRGKAVVAVRLACIWELSVVQGFANAFGFTWGTPLAASAATAPPLIRPSSDTARIVESRPVVGEEHVGTEGSFKV